MTSELFFDATSKDSSTPLTALESAGSVNLLKNSKNEFFAKGSFSDEYFRILPDNFGQSLSPIGAEHFNGKNYLAFQASDSKDIIVWLVNNKWKPRKFIEQQTPETQGYYESELLFQQDFYVNPNVKGAENNSSEPRKKGSSQTFWANEQYMKYLWGFYNYGQYNNSTPGADGKMADVFATLASPRSGIKNDKKSQERNTIAILDSGFNYNHQDINPNLWINKKDAWGDGVDNDKNGYIDDTYGYNFVANQPLGWDDDGHGTHVGGTAGGAANNVGVLGTNPAANLMNVKVLGKNGGSVAGVINGINYAVKNGAKVINMSLGGDYFSQSEYNALKNAQKKGSLIVASAGNEGRNIDIKPAYPAAFDLKSIITVAASDFNDWWTDFTNWGRKNVDLYAPGERILSSTHTSDTSYESWPGTSMAAPYVAGVISAYWARNPKLKPNKVKNKLLNSVDRSVWLSEYEQDTVSGGRINAAKFFGIKSFRNNSKSITGYSGPSREEPSKTPKPRIQRAFEITSGNIDDVTGRQLTPFLLGSFKDSTKKRLRGYFKDIDKDLSELKFGQKIDASHFDALGGTLFSCDLSDLSRRQRLTVAKVLLENDFVDYLELDTPVFAA